MKETVAFISRPRIIGFLTLENGTGRLPQNVGKELPLLSVY
jgi:hypothetical protein